MSRKRDLNSERFVTHGTEQPLDVQDVKAKDRNNYLPVWQQEARDEKGKKRLHGAFTGGFSAGYYNSVGSKEGWTPSTFTSQKQSLTSQHNQQPIQKIPQDFMDEEDMEEFIGGNKVLVNEEYDVLGGTEREVKRRKELANIS